MASTTYEHPGGVTEMYAVQRRFRDAAKTFARLSHACNIQLRALHARAMVRNAGQLPQPFWLGAAHGGGSCSAARCAART